MSLEEANVVDSRDCTESKIGKVLLIGVTGGTGGNVVKGFLEQGVTNIRAITRKIDRTPFLCHLNLLNIQ